MLIKLIKLVSWIIGLALIFFGALGISDSAIGGILTILSGLIIAPFTYNKIKKRLRGGQITRVVLAGALLAIGAPLMINNGLQTMPQKNYFTPRNEKSNEQPLDITTLSTTLNTADKKLVDAISTLTSRDYNSASDKAMGIINDLNKPLTQARGSEDETATDNILARHLHALLIYKTAQLLKQKDAVFARIEETEIINLLPQLELLERGYGENAKDWNETADIIKEMGVNNLSEQTLNNFRLIADTQQGFADDIHEKISEFRALVPDYVPVKEKIIPETTPVSSDGKIITAKLQKFFNSFDSNGDGKLSIKEAQDFFYWAEDNITYRYDDENETNPFVGTLVGDNRPGPDMRQTPLETYDESAGDCEDMSTLEQAFYQYFGIDAYVVGVNAETASGIDHASLVVRIAEHVQEFKDFLGDIFYYEINDSAEDIFGNPIPPGAYMVVDNSYSAAFGSISGGVMEGRYKIHCAIPLDRGYGDEWQKIVNRCAVEMD